MTRAATIYALASGAGRAGVAVIRLSGPGAGAALDALAGEPRPRPRRAVRRRLSRPGDGEALDDALVIWFPGPDSFTGEDVAELHIHGGSAVIAAVADALALQADLRLAEPGEFTRRAFAHDKLDLTAAEALADLVDAETEGQRRQALRQMEGGLSRLYEAWRETLIKASALIEAEIDFADDDLPGDLAARARPLLASLAGAIDAHLSDRHRGERVRDGYRVAIIGAPNAGKSSVLNALAAREAAIVSEIPGTTRDVVEVRLTLAGFPVWIADTAGLRVARDAIEVEGVRRALERAGEADLRIAVIAADAVDLDADMVAALRPNDLIVINKTDLLDAAAARLAGALAVERGCLALRAAARDGAGIPALLEALAGATGSALTARETPPLTRARHRALLGETRAALARAEAAFARGPELAAEDLRLAARALGRITGRVDVEHILDEVFSQFCIGK